MSTVENTQRNRFKDAPWFPKADIILLIGGAGGIGSWLTVLLTRAGFKVAVYDFDMLEEHNLGGQLFPRNMIGKPKVEALAGVVKDFASENLMIFNEKIDADTPTNIFAFSAFDNMEARKVMYEKWEAEFSSDPAAIFIDGRLTAEHMQIFCVRGGSSDTIRGYQDSYKKEHLFNDSEVEDAPCTMKQTSHAAAMIASHMTGFFTNHFTNVVEEDNTRTVPFKWEYFIPMDLIEQTV